MSETVIPTASTAVANGCGGEEGLSAAGVDALNAERSNRSGTAQVVSRVHFMVQKPHTGKYRLVNSGDHFRAEAVSGITRAGSPSSARDTLGARTVRN